MAFLSKLKPYRFRILALFLLSVFLLVTWRTFHQLPMHPEDLHISLQTQLKALIQKTLSEKEPDSSQVEFHKMWTEPTKEKNQITAQFEYSYDQENITIQVKGSALIIKQNLKSSDYELWVVQSIRTDNWSVDFQEPIVLFSDKNYQESTEIENTDSEQEIEASEEPEATEISDSKPETKAETVGQEVKPSENPPETTQEVKNIEETETTKTPKPEMAKEGATSAEPETPKQNTNSETNAEPESTNEKPDDDETDDDSEPAAFDKAL